MKNQTNYYFESHITIDPVENVEKLKDLVKPNSFRVAKLLMEKDKPSNLDSFMTAHSKDYDDIYNKTIKTVELLQLNKYKVRRYKIENILLDVRMNQ